MKCIQQKKNLSKNFILLTFYFSDDVTKMMKCKTAKSKKILKKTFVQQRKEYRRIKQCEDNNSILTKIWQFVKHIFGMENNHDDCNISSETKPRDGGQDRDLLKVVGHKSSHVPKEFFKIVENSNMNPSSQMALQSSKNKKRNSKNKESCKNYLFENKKFTCLCT